MADGYLNFDTSINTSGFNKDAQKISGQAQKAAEDVEDKSVDVSEAIKSSFKKVGAVIAAAFSVKQVIQFSNEAKSLWDTQVEAETKLETVMRQRLKANDEVIQSVKNLASEQQELGVIGDEVQLAGAQQLATFLNESESIKTLLPAMNNLLAQQNGLNASTSDATSIGNLLGKAMQGQASALTRVGITFTDAQEQILKYGTESEKAATLAQVIKDNVGDMNAALAQTDAGKQAQLANTMGDVKEQFGAAVTQIQALFLPALTSLTEILAKFAAYAREATSAIAGVFGAEFSTSAQAVSKSTKQVSNNADSAAVSYEDMAQAAEDAEEANENQLANFDQINKLSDDKSSSKDAGSSNSSATPITVAPVAVPIEADINSSDLSKKIKSSLKTIKKLFSSFGSWLSTNFGGIFSHMWDGLVRESLQLGETLSGIWTDIQTLAEPLKTYFSGDFTTYLQTVFATLGNIAVGLFDTFNMVFSDLWDVAVFPILQKFVTDGLPVITQFATEMWSTTDTAFSAIKELFDTFWSEGIVPILDLISGVISDLFEDIHSFWDKWGKPIFDGVREAIDKTKDIILDLWETVISPVIDHVVDGLHRIWDEHLRPLVQEFLDFVGVLADGALRIYNEFIAPIVSWLIEKLGPIFVKVFNAIWDKVEIVFSGIIDLVKDIIKVFKGIIKFITGVFTGDWEEAWEGIKDIFGGIWDALVDIIKTPLNLIIDAVNKMLEAIEDAINWVIDGINTLSFDVPDWVPGIGGETFGFDLSYIDIPEIPKLALGTVVPANYGEFLAVLGDNKREAEVVSPLSTIKQAVMEALVALNGSEGSTGQKQPATIVIQIDKKTVGRAVIDDINEYTKRNGKSPLNA